MRYLIIIFNIISIYFKKIIDPFLVMFDMLFCGYWLKDISTTELNFKDNQENILVVVPHIDDETLGIGGILKKHDCKNNTIRIIFTTDGCKSYSKYLDESTMAKHREIEAYQLCSLFNNISIIFLRAKSMNWEVGDICDKLRNEIEDFKPNIIYVPYVRDINRDHVLNAKSLCKAVENSNYIIRMFQVQSPMPCRMYNRHCNISSEYSFKINAIYQFKSQYAMKQSFNKVLFYNKLLARKYKIQACECICECSPEAFQKFCNTSADSYPSDQIKTITAGRSILYSIISTCNKR